MTKLEIVRRALKENPNVIVVAVEECNYLPKKSGFWSHTVDFIVAPKKGLYTADELQKFMMELIKLEPTQVKEFRQAEYFRHREKVMELGMLFFDEEIGTEKRIITLTDKELFDTKGFQNGRMVVEDIALRRRVWVSVYPNKEIADKRYGRYNKHWISLQQLEEFQLKQIPIQR